jgi:hypothetical protein
MFYRDLDSYPQVPIYSWISPGGVHKVISSFPFPFFTCPWWSLIFIFSYLCLGDFLRDSSSGTQSSHPKHCFFNSHTSGNGKPRSGTDLTEVWSYLEMRRVDYYRHLIIQTEDLDSLGTIRPIRVDHTKFHQVSIKTHSFNNRQFITWNRHRSRNRLKCHVLWFHNIIVVTVNGIDYHFHLL